MESGGVRRSLMVVLALMTLMSVLPGGAAEPSPAQPESTPSQAPVADDVWEALEQDGETEVVVHLDEEADLSAAHEISDWSERGRYVFETLRQHADRTQAALQQELEVSGTDFQSFWIANALVVKTDRATVQTMASNDAVSDISLAEGFKVPDVEFTPADNEVQATEWGLDAIRAPEVWDEFDVTGEGVVVGVIDTGTAFDHPAIAEAYRGAEGETVDHDYNWFDPSGVCGPEPCDNVGHGTHVTGTILGDDHQGNQIGVAPGAQWISAKGCATDLCTSPDLLAAGQWMLAPTLVDGSNPDPDRRPHIVNNSWGGNPGSDWYMEMVDNWIAAGMFPQFASGNPGSICSLAGAPGNYSQSYSTGGFDVNGVVYDRSGRGPSQIDGGVKPNISAPAVDVRSSLPDGGYGTATGTSMASPHVAGTLALMWSAAPVLVGEIDLTRAILDQTAIDTSDLSCGGTPERNNVFGEGKLDAYEAVSQSPRGEIGFLEGTVTDTDGEPVATAAIHVAGSNERFLTTDADGFYSAPLTVGDYEVNVDAYGYEPVSESVTISTDVTETLDFSLTAIPLVTVSGTVSDASGQDWPLYARVDVDGYPGGPVFTDPVTGSFTVDLATGHDTALTVTPVLDGYEQMERDLVVTPEEATQDFDVAIDLAACDAAGYEMVDGTCESTGGGLVVGEVSSRETDEDLTGARISGPGAGEVVEAVGTPDDNALGEGFYILFVPTVGSAEISANMSYYEEGTGIVEVTAETAVRHDIALGAGVITTDRDSIEATVELGSTTEMEVTLSNDGSVSANYEIGATRPQFQVMDSPEAPESSGDHLTDSSSGIGSVDIRPSGAEVEGEWATDAQSSIAADDFWIEGPSLPVGLVRYAHAQCAGDPENFYVLTGLDESIASTAKMWRYNARTAEWTELASAPQVPSVNLTAVCVEGESIHLMGGGINFGTRRIHSVYDIDQDSWDAAAQPPRSVWGAEAAYWQGKIYLIGGGTVPAFGPPSDEVNVYDVLSDRWLDDAEPMPQPAAVPGLAQVGRYAYIVGGWGPPGPSIHLGTTQRLDLSTGEWTLGPELINPRGGMAINATQNALYAVGGSTPGAAPNSGSTIVERLDYSDWPNGEWVQIDHLPTPKGVARGGFCTHVRPDEAIWSVGGGDQSITDTVLYAHVDDGGCASSVEVPWLVGGESGVIEAGTDESVTVTLDGSEVSQPGTYEAELVVRSDTPGLADPIPMTLNVEPTETTARLTGGVIGLGHCDGPGSVPPGAEITVDGSAAPVDKNGVYVWWLTPGSHTIEATAPGYIPVTDEVDVAAGERANRDLELRLDAPCPESDTDGIDLEVTPGEVSEHEIMLGNTGFVTYQYTTSLFPFVMNENPAVEPTGETADDTERQIAGADPGYANRDHDGGSALEASPMADTWVPGPDLFTGLVRYGRAQCLGDDEGFYVASGVPLGGGVTTDLLRYDQGSDSWEELDPMPIGGEGVVAVCADGALHVMGGGPTGGGTDNHFIYNLFDGTWEFGAPLPRPVWGAAAGYWDGRIYLAGGNVSFNPALGVSGEVNVYDIASDTWIGTAQEMPTPATAVGHIIQDHYLYVVGGWSAESPVSNVGVTQRFDMIDGTWTTGPSLNDPRGDLAVSVTDRALYAVGGNPENRDDDLYMATDTVERLDLSGWPGGEWEIMESIPRPTVAMSGACTTSEAGAEVWSVGGATTQEGISAYTYHSPRNGEACETGNLETPWITIESGESSVDPGAEVSLVVGVDTTELGLGTHTATVVVVTSDRQGPRIEIPISVTVTDDPSEDPDDSDDDGGNDTPPDRPGDDGGDGPGGEEPGQDDGDKDGPQFVEPDPDFRFGDVAEGHLFDYEIHWLAANKITIGCNPPENSMFCPDGVVSRGQMAAFLVRALDLEAADVSFVDTGGHLFEAEIAALAAAGVTYGCNPPENSMFCPDGEVSRGQMAAFLYRSLGR